MIVGVVERQMSGSMSSDAWMAEGGVYRLLGFQMAAVRIRV